MTQEQIEEILTAQFEKTQEWQFVLIMLVLIVPFVLLALWGFSDVNFWLRLGVYIVLGITLLKCERWVVARRVRKTIEAIRQV